MEKKERYVVAVVSIVLLAGVFFLFQQGGEETVRVREDPVFTAALLESNTVVLRLYYPFTDARGPGAAVTYATQVFVFNGKKVVVQVVEGNRCTRSLLPGGETREVPRGDCLAESEGFPTIEVREAAEDSIRQEGPLTAVAGRPEHIPLMVRFVILKAYPDADRVIAYTKEVLASIS